MEAKKSSVTISINYTHLHTNLHMYSDFHILWLCACVAERRIMLGQAKAS